MTRHLIECGHEVVRLVRKEPSSGEVFWDPNTGKIDTAGIEGFDAVVHLASMPWPMRWTTKAKQRIHANRLATNRLLAESLAACECKPRVLICASDIGYYASSGDTVLTEDSPAGTSFLARLQQEGEAATTPASEAGIRRIQPAKLLAAGYRFRFPELGDALLHEMENVNTGIASLKIQQKETPHD